jgi:hypothetical protein
MIAGHSFRRQMAVKLEFGRDSGGGEPALSSPGEPRVRVVRGAVRGGFWRLEPGQGPGARQELT